MEEKSNPLNPTIAEKPKVLIVDDIVLNIQVLHETLKDNYEVFFATNGRDALKVAESILPDIILLDVMMPEISGYDVLKEIKANASISEIPVIIITALEDVENELIGLNLGAIDYITKPINPQIVSIRVKNQIELKKSRDMLNNLSRIDGLTAVANRRAFDEMFEKEWLRAKRTNSPLSLIMIDIDYFKDYNDYFGHSAGDVCLKNVANTIKSSLNRPADMVARYGGEEFVCLLPDTDEHGAQLTASRIRENIEKMGSPHPSSKVCDVVTVSLGVTTSFSTDDINKNSILLIADRALYQAKSEGRNRYFFLSKTSSKSDTAAQFCSRHIEGRNLKELLVSFTEENPNPIICLRKDGSFLHGNMSAKTLFPDWCCNVGDSVPESLNAICTDNNEKFNIELQLNNKTYEFSVIPLVGRDVIFAIVSDITDKKLAENEINKLKRVINESINIVFITDYEGKIEYVNSTFEKITGFSHNEAIGQNPRILASGETSAANYKNLWNTIKSGKTWRGVFKNKKKSGDIYWANGFISPIKNDNGDITHFMAIQEDITDKMLSETKLQYLSSFDPVTSIINRARFVEMITEIINGKRINFGCLIFVNIDAFKLINDTYGYSIGDQFLKSFAEFLKGLAVEIDILSEPTIDTIVGRLGGDEFGLFFSNKDEKQSVNIAEDIRQKIEKNRFLNDTIRITASIGIALYPEHAENVSGLLIKANSAVNKAKELGQNRWYLFHKSDTYLKTAPSSLEEKQRIITAMEEDRFFPYFQPILELKTRQIHHYEALARLIAPDDTVIMPSSFIFTAEKYGLIAGIDKIITYKTMQIQSELKRLGRHVTFSVNLSGKHLGDNTMLQHLRESIEDTNADPKHIVFELTETAAIHDFKSALIFVKELKKIGCRFSLDDFGVGFTSFVHIIEMEVDFIKIDGSFVRNIGQSQRNRILVKTISELARGLNIKTIAEYVDTEETLNIISELGVDYAQGYLIGMPASRLI